MVLALRKNWSLSSPAADFAVPKLGIISAKQTLLQMPLPTPGGRQQGCEKHSCQSLVAEQLGSSKHGLGAAPLR